MNILLFLTMLISTGILITADLYNIAILTVVFKCLSSMLFIATAWSSYKKNPANTKFFIFMFSGLIFSLAGDVFLVFDKNQGVCFILGVCSFSIGHVMYSLGYCHMSKLALKDILLFLSIFIPTLLVISTGKFEFGGMKMLVVFYAVIISFMVSKSLSMLKFYSNSKKSVLLMISGSLLFFISDCILLFLFFYPGAAPVLQQINLSLYYPGQGLLALSFSYPLKGRLVES